MQTGQIPDTSPWVVTHWGLVTHIFGGNLAIVGSDNALSPGQRQAIIWPNAGIFELAPLGTNFSEILVVIYIFSLKYENVCEMAAILCRPQCVNMVWPQSL